MARHRFGGIPVRFRVGKALWIDQSALPTCGSTSMEESARVKIFEAQVKNVRALDTAWRQLNRSVNTALVNSDKPALGVFTKLLLQVYCAYAEAVFSKTIHTPAGFSLDEIQQIKQDGSRNGIVSSWKKAVTLALAKNEVGRSNHRPNAEKKIFELIDKYILDPSLFRNKIAHGQWITALNRENTTVNETTTTRLNSLNAIDIQRFRTAFISIAKIVEDLVESPNKAHLRDYWIHITDLEENTEKMAGWTLEEKEIRLKNKKTYR